MGNGVQSRRETDLNTFGLAGGIDPGLRELCVTLVHLAGDDPPARWQCARHPQRRAAAERPDLQDQLRL